MISLPGLSRSVASPGLDSPGAVIHGVTLLQVDATDAGEFPSDISSAPLSLSYRFLSLCPTLAEISYIQILSVAS